jgi:asparagine synthase (glutamine-hydrolysing)
VTVGPTASGLELIEFASGVVLGNDESIPEPRHLQISARDALEGVLVSALNNPPCGVSFSGGRDSSGVLAAAAEAARKFELPLPIPVTLRFPGVEGTDESSFQEMVVRHLGLPEWVVLEPGDTLDVTGKLATSVTHRHGLLYPANIHFHAPIFEALSGGTVMTGLGGDEMLAANSNHDLASMLRGRRPPSRALMRQLIKRYILRDRVRDRIRSDHQGLFPWLVPEARHELIERIVEWLDKDYLWADKLLTSFTYRMRYLHKTEEDMARLGADYRVDVVHPYLDPGLVGAIAARMGRVGPGSRMELMESLYGDLLPPEVTQRTSKAVFDGVFWTPLAQETSQRLPVDLLPDLIDGAALLEFWRSDQPKGATCLIAKHLRQAMSSGGPSSQVPGSYDVSD